MTEPLLAYLRSRANAGGLVIASETRIFRDVGLSHDDLALALHALESQGQIEILSGPPYVTLKLVPWPDSSSDRVKKEQQISSNSTSPHREVPVSSSVAAATQTEDGGAGEGEALLDHVLDVLGNGADRDEFRAILLGHDPALIHRCLRRVQATKAIRVSRAALFRSLLFKLSK